MPLTRMVQELGAVPSAGVNDAPAVLAAPAPTGWEGGIGAVGGMAVVSPVHETVATAALGSPGPGVEGREDRCEADQCPLGDTRAETSLSSPRQHSSGTAAR